MKLKMLLLVALVLLSTFVVAEEVVFGAHSDDASDVDRTSVEETESADESTSVRRRGRERMVQAREKFQELKERRLQLKEDYSDRRARLLETKKALKECTDCTEDLSRIKEHLLAVIERMEVRLEETKSKVESSDRVDEDELAEIVAEVDARLETLEAYKGRVNALESKDDLKQVSRDLRKFWKETKEDVKEWKMRAYLMRYMMLFDRLEQLARKASVAEGDQEQMELLTKAIEESRANLQEARDAKISKDIPSFKENIREALGWMQRAHKVLKGL